MLAGLPALLPELSRDRATCGSASSKCAESSDLVPNCADKPVRQVRPVRRSGKRIRASPTRIQNLVPGSQLVAGCEWLLHSGHLVPERSRGQEDLLQNSDSGREL